MAEARLASHNSEKIAALAKVTDQHDIVLEEIQKQLQSLNQFCRRSLKQKIEENLYLGITTQPMIQRLQNLFS